jgi:hypothetical protein
MAIHFETILCQALESPRETDNARRFRRAMPRNQGMNTDAR